MINSARRCEYNYLSITFICFLLRINNKLTFREGLCRIRYFFNHGLIWVWNDFMDKKLTPTHVVLFWPVEIAVQISIIFIYIIQLYFKQDIALKIIIDSDFCNKLWIKCIMNHFCLANFTPHITISLEEQNYWIRFTKDVHIWQIETFKGKWDF